LVGLDKNGSFAPLGLKRECWGNAAPVRTIFRQAFERAALPYFNPHSFRDTLAQLGERICPTIEAYKAWSQNLGHERAMTTITSYGPVSPHRQAELIRGLDASRSDGQIDPALVAKVMAAMQQMAGVASGGEWARHS
jgi:hypothetical protein